MKKISSYFTAQPSKKQKTCVDEGTASSSLLQPACEVLQPQHHSEISASAQPDLEPAVLPVPDIKCTVVDPRESSWPSCWTVSQKDELVKKNDWLCFKDGKLGCSVCKKVGSLGVEKEMGMRMAREWVNFEVAFYGENRKQQLTSLRKKSLIIRRVLAIRLQ